MNDIFPTIPRIPYEGPDSDRPLAFKRYDPQARIGGLTAREALRFSMAFWHTMTGNGLDVFGAPTMIRPWDGLGDEMEVARMRMRGLFELTEKLSMPFFCFHDRDIAPEGDSLRETNRRLDEIVSLAKKLMASSPTR
ncbi:MAG TPA: xylose isomerase, partial [Rectinemataceae bacterium]|nr:xylose isomerase [Rectinemataceae bacterium]